MSQKKKEKLLVIDGNGLAYRAFYAVAPMQTSTGLHTPAVAGFIAMMMRLLKFEKPNYVVVAFDKGIPTERISYQDYNAHSEEMPEELLFQLPMIEDFVRALDIPVYRVPGHEADDCIGTITRQATDRGLRVRILSGDLELLQLVRPDVQVLTTRRGISDMMEYDEKMVQRRFNLKAEQLADLRALAGDSSDNIPGVPGIGEVTAKKLLSSHDGLLRLLKNMGALPAKWRNPLSEYKELALEYLRRAKIMEDLDLEVDWDQSRFEGIPSSRALTHYQRLELVEVLEPLPDEDASKRVESPEYQLFKKLPSKKEMESYLSSGQISLLFLGAGKEMLGVVLKADDKPVWVVRLDPEKPKLLHKLYDLLKPVWNNTEHDLYTHNLRAFLVQHDNVKEFGEHPNLWDVGLMNDMLYGRETNSWLDDVAVRYKLVIPGEGELLGHGLGYRKMSEVEPEELAQWASRRVCALRPLCENLKKELAEQDLIERYQQVELPFARAFAKMEKEGVRLDEGTWREFGEELDRLQKESLDGVYACNKEPFDVYDPKELSDVLFERLGLTVQARPKNGAPITDDILLQIGDQSPIGIDLLSYRALSKLKETYAYASEVFLEERHGWFSRRAQFPVPSSERIQWMGPAALGGAVATFNRLLSEIAWLPKDENTLTLRQKLLSCLEAKEGHTLLGIQIDQIQVRLLAHFTKAEKLIQTYEEQKNGAKKLAMKLQQAELESFSQLHKREWIDILMGTMGRYRLAKRLGVGVEEAAELIALFEENLKTQSPELSKYFEDQIEQAKKTRRVVSLGGHHRLLPELRSRNSDIKTTAMRLARTSQIQASAADLIKELIVSLSQDAELWSKAKWQILLRDEILLEVSDEDFESVRELLEVKVRDLRELDVPLCAQFHEGKNWCDRKSLSLSSSGS